MSQRSVELKKRWNQGEVTYGAWLGLADPYVAEIMAGAGFDFILIDAEHGAHTLATLPTTLMAFNARSTVPIVRAPWNDAVFIKRALDAGVDGVISPMIANVEECRAFVRSCLYPPDGVRGFGPWRASDYGRDVDGYAATANASIIVMPQIEDVEAARQAGDILAVPGVDAVLIGPTDLSGTAGVLRQFDHPKVTEGVEQIVAAAAKRGIPACMGVPLPADEGAQLALRGARMVLTTEDGDLLAVGAAQALAAGKAAVKVACPRLVVQRLS